MTGHEPAGSNSIPRIALFACPCCGGSSSLPVAPGARPPARRACPNGGCWACLGACRGTAARTELLKAAPKPGRLPQTAAGPRTSPRAAVAG